LELAVGQGDVLEQQAAPLAVAHLVNEGFLDAKPFILSNALLRLVEGWLVQDHLNGFVEGPPVLWTIRFDREESPHERIQLVEDQEPLSISPLVVLTYGLRLA